MTLIKPCSIQGCLETSTKRGFCKGLCKKHYDQTLAPRRSQQWSINRIKRREHAIREGRCVYPSCVDPPRIGRRTCQTHDGSQYRTQVHRDKTKKKNTREKISGAL